MAKKPCFEKLIFSQLLSPECRVSALSDEVLKMLLIFYKHSRSKNLWGRVQLNAETAPDLIVKDPDVCGAGCEERQRNIEILCGFILHFTPG